MNVETLLEEFQEGNLSKGDSVTVTGQIRWVGDIRSGEHEEYGPWSLIPVLFGTSDDAVRITLMNPPSDLDLNDLKGKDMKLKAKVDPYDGKLQLKIADLLKQLNTAESAPTQGDDDVTPAKPMPVASSAGKALADKHPMDADDMLELLVQLRERAYKKAKREQFSPDTPPNPEDDLTYLYKEAGRDARSAFIELSRSNKLRQALNELQIPF